MADLPTADAQMAMQPVIDDIALGPPLDLPVPEQPNPMDVDFASNANNMGLETTGGLNLNIDEALSQPAPTTDARVMPMTEGKPSRV